MGLGRWVPGPGIMVDADFCLALQLSSAWKDGGGVEFSVEQVHSRSIYAVLPS